MSSPNPPDRPALTRALEAFEQFQQRIVALHVPAFTSLDITMAQAKLLYVVMAEGGLSMSETASRLGVTVSTASGAVDHLVALGLLSRLDDPNNRRQVRISITQTGIDVLEQMRELSTRQLTALFEHVSDEDLDVVRRATEILAEAAVSAAPQPPTAPPTTTRTPETAE